MVRGMLVRIHGFLIRISKIVVIHGSILTILFSLVYLRAMAEPDIGWVACDNHYAIEIPDSEPFAGSYVKCENFNKMQKALERGDLEAARKLLLVVK